MTSESRWPTSPNEAARLRELASFEVSPVSDEAAYDGLVEIAAAIFDAPIAILGLMGAETQWFKAKIGTSLPSTPREKAFCNHTLLTPHTLVVEDMTLDPRFCDHPYVTGEPHIRFYAGTPLTTRRGERIGTLCVFDVKPRQVEPRLLRLLERLSTQAVSLMEADRLSHRLSKLG